MAAAFKTNNKKQRTSGEPRDFVYPAPFDYSNQENSEAMLSTSLSSCFSESTNNIYSMGKGGCEQWQRWFRNNISSTRSQKPSLLLDMVDQDIELKMEVPSTNGRSAAMQRRNGSLEIELEHQNHYMVLASLPAHGSLTRCKASENREYNRARRLSVGSDISRGSSIFEGNNNRNETKHRAGSNFKHTCRASTESEKSQGSSIFEVSSHLGPRGLTRHEEAQIFATDARIRARIRSMAASTDPFAFLIPLSRKKSSSTLGEDYSGELRVLSCGSSNSNEHFGLKSNNSLVLQQQAILSQIQQERQEQRLLAPMKQQPTRQLQQLQPPVLPANHDFSQVREPQKQITLFGCRACGQMMRIDLSIPLVYCPTCGSLSRAEWKSDR